MASVRLAVVGTGLIGRLHCEVATTEHDAGQANANFLGTDAALSFPLLERWSYGADQPDPGWRATPRSEVQAVTANGPYVDQLRDLAGVVRGTAARVASGPDGLRSLAGVEAVIEAARQHGPVNVDDPCRESP